MKGTAKGCKLSEKRYERIDAEGLLEPLKSPSASVYGMLLDCGHGLDIRDVGIWPGAAHEWHPSVDIPASARSTRLIHTPALPFPFDGADLAAFMLDGLGAWVRDYYGTDGAVDEEQLRTIALSYDYSRDAVREAFDLLNEAIKVIGPEPDSNTPEWIEWRRAMVRKLHEMRQGAPALAGPGEAVPLLGACEVEALEERAARRLREFLALGGAVSVSGGVAVLGGKQGALQKLADRERAAGRKRSDRSDISKELRAEALRQRASRA